MDRRSDYDAYRQVLAQVEYAEQMGFEAFFTVEHHFLDEYSHCPAPEVLYGAIAQRTRKMRIRHGVRLLPTCGHRDVALPYADLQGDPSAGDGLNQVNRPTRDSIFQMSGQRD